MIQAISSSKITKTNNYTDVKSKSATQISFKGINVSKIGREIIGDTGSKAERKIVKLAEELIGSVKRSFRKLKVKEELPYSEKPITCNIHTDEKMKAELDRRAEEEVMVNARKKEAEEAIKKAGHNVSSSDIDEGGHLTSWGEEKVNNPTRAHRHHEEFDDNSNDRLSFGGNSYDKVREGMDRIQKSPWLSNEEKSEELIRLSGHNLEAGDIDSQGHLTTMGQHKIDNPSSIHRPDDSITFRGDGHDGTIDEDSQNHRPMNVWEESEAKAQEQRKPVVEQREESETTIESIDDNSSVVDSPESDFGGDAGGGDGFDGFDF